jgi:hypothetical protein
MINPRQSGYSADVRMHLTVDGEIYPIAQLGPDFIILATPVDHPPARGEITFSVDGRVRRWPVLLPNGIAAGMEITRTAMCAGDDNAAA